MKRFSEYLQRLCVPNGRWGKLKTGEIFLSLGCLVLVTFQLLRYSSSGCVVAFANVPEVCGENVKYILTGLILTLAPKTGALDSSQQSA